MEGLVSTGPTPSSFIMCFRNFLMGELPFYLGYSSFQEFLLNCLQDYSTAISWPGGYELYRLASNMPKSQKKPQAATS